MTPARPSAQSVAPVKSTRSSEVRSTGGTAIRISASAAMTSGTFRAKTQRHEVAPTIAPPASGPAIEAIAPQAVHEPTAAPRCSGGKAMTMIASELGVTSAPAAPCSARATIRKPIVGATAQASESTPNAATPMAKTRRSP